LAFSSLVFRDRLALGVQLWVGRLFAPLWVPSCTAIMHWGLHWRIEGVADVRRAFRRLRRESKGPLLVCPNHLTMFDSFVVAHALGSPWWFLANHSALPWNTPERENFGGTWWKRVLLYVMKCVPIQRGGDRRVVGATLDRIVHLMERGEVALVFPEGRRSRTGRVERGALTYGVGRIVKALPGCRVLCVYLRGDSQDSWSERPAKGERFRVAIEDFQPDLTHGGMRGSVDIARQILARLEAMERKHFDGRE